jgi:hypothetical protein
MTDLDFGYWNGSLILFVDLVDEINIIVRAQQFEDGDMIMYSYNDSYDVVPTEDDMIQLYVDLTGDMFYG